MDLRLQTPTRLCGCRATPDDLLKEVKKKFNLRKWDHKISFCSLTRLVFAINRPDDIVDSFCLQFHFDVKTNIPRNIEEK